MAYFTLAINKVRFCIHSYTNCLTEQKSNSSLSQILNTTSATNFKRLDFLNWIPESNSNWDTQLNCNHTGYNISGYGYNCRFGISMNNENDCSTNDSAIGFGCQTNSYSSDRYESAGGHRWNPTTNFSKQGWIFIK